MSKAEFFFNALRGQPTLRSDIEGGRTYIKNTIDTAILQGDLIGQETFLKDGEVSMDTVLWNPKKVIFDGKT